MSDLDNPLKALEELERARGLAMIAENQSASFHKLIPSSEYATGEEGTPIYLIVKTLIERGRVEVVCHKESVNWGEYETLWEVVNDVCIELGLSNEDFVPQLRDYGCSISIAV